jgi:hypothetical protein
MPSEMLTKQKDPSSATPPAAVASEKDELRAATRQHVRRVRRLKINVAAWVVGTILLTTLWVVNQWQDNGALKSFGHEGEAGQWNPTLWALAVGIWGLIVGIMALRVHFEQPGEGRIGRMKFHVAAWVLGMLVLTPALGADRVAGQRRLRALQQQQPARQLGAVDPVHRRYLGSRDRGLRSACVHHAAHGWG